MLSASETSATSSRKVEEPIRHPRDQICGQPILIPKYFRSVFLLLVFHLDKMVQAETYRVFFQ